MTMTKSFSSAAVSRACWGTDMEETSPNLFQYLRNWVKHGVPAPRNEEEIQQYKWLFSFLAFCALWYAVDPVAASWVFNPWGFSVYTWLFWFSAKQWSLENYNDFVMYILRNFGFKKLPTGPIPGVPEHEMELEPIDFFYLRVNAVIDMVFLSVMTYLAAATGVVFGAPDAAVVGTTLNYLLTTSVGFAVHEVVRILVSAAVLILISDGCYAVLHWAMHQFRSMYHAVHRHHHRIVRPQGGLVDVRNYHPIELVLSSSVFVIALSLAGATVGVTWMSALIAFSGQVAANVANHSGYDVRFLTFHSGDHEMHHRVPTCNMGIVTYFVDKLVLKTYRPYAP